MGPLAILMAVVGVALAVAYYLVDFLIVAEDREVRDALAAAPGRLGLHFGALLPVGLVSAAISATLSVALTGLGLRTLWLAGPLWAWFGTWLSAGVLAVVSAPAE